MSNLLIELFTLPLLPVRFGADLLQRTLEGMQAVGERGARSIQRETAGARPLAPSVAPGRRYATAAGRQPAPAVPGGGSSNGPPYDTGPLGATGRRPNKEDREMSCNCCGSDYCGCESNVECPQVSSDRSLGGRCCVKVVQYTIISVRSDAQDNDRIIAGPTTMAFSDDLDDAAFTAWVMSVNCDEINQRVRPQDRKYLRVAYQVFARFAEEEPNYCQAQVTALERIARSLSEEDRGRDRQKLSGGEGGGSAGQDKGKGKAS